ncbi:MAG: rhodanese-like domain-containing protein [Capsulimonas sp.]|jgi:rhodanese-related sulfurtransferase|uniref:rhodanese-like domain-containing protein n=1 Tax=Capsulimonas sp. TaxID=2494211 RepID=UPI003266D08A
MVFKPAYSHLSAAELQERLENGDHPTLVDVRTPAEYFQYHLENVQLIPIDEFASRAAGELSSDEEIVLICEHGVRSEMAAQYLASLGYENVATMDGGMAAYQGEVVHGE